MNPSDSHAPSVLLKSDRRGRVRSPAAHREALLDAFEQTCMSGAELARQHDVAYPTFLHWMGQRRKVQGSADHQESPGSIRLHEILVDTESATSISPHYLDP